jgi:hypothetical protein
VKKELKGNGIGAPAAPSPPFFLKNFKSRVKSPSRRFGTPRNFSGQRISINQKVKRISNQHKLTGKGKIALLRINGEAF